LCDKPQAQLWQATLTLSTGGHKTDGVKKLILTISCSFLTFAIGLGISGVTSTLRTTQHMENDAIFAGIFEKAGASYIYENGTFRAIITSD